MRAKKNWCPEEAGLGEGQADPPDYGLVLCCSRITLTQMRCRFGSGNITDTVLETISPEVEKHVKIPLALGYPGYSLPSTPGQRRRKHT